MTMIIKNRKRYCSTSGDAKDIIYNNENSSLEATDVQNAIDEMQNNLGGFSFYNNPTVVYLVSDGSIYVDANDNYILADSVSGSILLADTTTYTTNIVEGNFYRIEGADSVLPFSKDNSEAYKHIIIDSLQNTKLELTYDSTWEEIAAGLNELFPETLNVLSYLGVSSLSASGTSYTSAEFDITNFNTMQVTASRSQSWSTWYSAWGSQPASATAYLMTTSGNISLIGVSTVDISSYTGMAYIKLQGYSRKVTASTDGSNDPDTMTTFTASTAAKVSKMILSV